MEGHFPPFQLTLMGMECETLSVRMTVFGTNLLPAQ